RPNRRPRLSQQIKPRIAYSLLIIQTDPEDAEIKIDGEPEGLAKGGLFLKQFPSGKSYTVEINAGADYVPMKKVVTLDKKGGYEIIEADLAPKYAVVRIGPIRDGAKIFVDDKPVSPANLRIDQESNTYMISGLLPGKHKIVYDHPDYVIVEREFDVVAGTEYTRFLTLERATVELAVTTDPGTAVFVDSEPVGKTPADGKLRLSDIKIGKHEIKLVKDGYEEYKKTEQFEFRKPVALNHRMVPLPTSSEFNDDFDAANVERWTMPASGWAIRTDGRLHIENAPSLGFPTGVRYRDFIMTFHLKLADGKGAAWAVRARDGNYYLFYLSGPDGLFRNRFNVYIVRDNRFDPSNYFQSVPIITELKPGGEFTVMIKAVKNRIEHMITSSESGKTENLGFFEDPEIRFVIGGIGFRTVGPEKFSVDDLFVRPLADATGK
ncbi:MAG TPA: PEGA domain-containing protein, partial [Blastocatellia bacterium]|nr:PEGA domain-containing protein [Blastocatellia bacterium]